MHGLGDKFLIPVKLSRLNVVLDGQVTVLSE